MKLKWHMAQTADFQIRELLYLNVLIKYVLIILFTLSYQIT